MREKECSYRSLAVPSLLILIGLAIINGPALFASETPSTYLVGLLTCFIALFTFSWYVVANARFLKSNREISSSAGRLEWRHNTFLGHYIFVRNGSFFQRVPRYEKYLIFTPQLALFLAAQQS